MPRPAAAAAQEQPPAVATGLGAAHHRDEVSPANEADLQTGGRRLVHEAARGSRRAPWALRPPARGVANGLVSGGEFPGHVMPWLCQWQVSIARGKTGNKRRM